MCWKGLEDKEFSDQDKIVTQIQVMQPTINEILQIQAVSSYFISQIGILEIVVLNKLLITKWSTNMFPFSSKSKRLQRNSENIIYQEPCNMV